MNEEEQNQADDDPTFLEWFVGGIKNWKKSTVFLFGSTITISCIMFIISILIDVYGMEENIGMVFLSICVFGFTFTVFYYLYLVDVKEEY